MNTGATAQESVLQKKKKKNLCCIYHSSDLCVYITPFAIKHEQSHVSWFSFFNLLLFLSLFAQISTASLLKISDSPPFPIQWFDYLQHYYEMFIHTLYSVFTILWH